MNTQTGAILFVAGTCIGSGMIALPMVFASLGIIPSLILMGVVWFFMYYTSLINIELNLQAGKGLSLGALGRVFSGRGAEILGNILLKLLSYSLLAAYLYGGTSIIQKLMATHFGGEPGFGVISFIYVALSFGVLLFPFKVIDPINRFLFFSLIAVVSVLILGLLFAIDWSHLPLISNRFLDRSAWMTLMPVVFTAFGFQVIFHTLTNYCKSDPAVLKKAFFFGSLIPAVIYMLWIFVILSAVHHDNPAFYQSMISGEVDVGSLVEVLSHIAGWSFVQLMVWWISLLAIITSVIGVGVGLVESISVMLKDVIPGDFLRKSAAAFLTLFPPYLIALCVPNAFIAVLGFAGLVLAFIAILLPTYLFFHLKNASLHYRELKSKVLIAFSCIFAILVILSEFFNMF